MCGIAGFWQFVLHHKCSISQEIESMVAALHHRGPDDQGIWIQGDVALGQTRLSIIDLTPTGHQPMISPDGRYVLVFNGEIYNYKSLAKELKNAGCVFDLTGDSQVLLLACMHWGIEKTLLKLNGMFAFGFYDCKAKQLILARDRFGEKPLYYTQTSVGFAFASELKALTLLSQFDKTIDKKAIDLYLRLNYIPCPYSIYQSAKKLFPGHYLVVNEGRVEEKCYYDLASEVGSPRQTSLPHNELIHVLDEKLQTSVRERMVADVPVGAFLSGGIDSSLMVALMQSQSSLPIKTFTVGFKNSCWDESQYAEGIAKHLGTDHTTVYISPDEILEGTSEITRIYDEPFGDASALSTYCICKQFRKHVKVAIGGDGGDELFVGYHRHKWVDRLNFLSKMAPNLGLRLLEKINYQFLSNKNPIFSNKIRKGLYSLKGKTLLETYLNSVSYWPVECDLKGTWFKLNPMTKNGVEQTAYLDLKTFLHDDVLCKVDRASMAVGLETRAPFLDYDLSQFAFSIPIKQKFPHRIKKYFLKCVLEKYLPKLLWDRPKMGFGMPLAQAIRSQLKSTFERYLQADTLLWLHLDKNKVQQIFNEHLSKKINHEHLLWNFFVMQQFLVNRDN